MDIQVWSKECDLRSHALSFMGSNPISSTYFKIIYFYENYDFFIKINIIRKELNIYPSTITL